MPDLFPEPGPPIPGLRLIPDFLNEEQRQFLHRWLAVLPEEAWGEIRFRGVIAKRKMICYGWDYVTTSRSLKPAPAMPPPLQRLRDAAGSALGIDTSQMEQLILARYPPTAGIGPHIDAPVFGDKVMGVSLGGVGRLRFSRKDHPSHTAVLPSGTLYLMAGECRSSWLHRLQPVKQTRYAFTFRALRDRPAAP